MPTSLSLSTSTSKLRWFTLRSGTTKGFTLVELLIVIAILAVLTAIGFATYSGVQSRARDAKRAADIDAISKALEANYQLATYSYIPPAASQFAGGGLPEDPKATGTVCLGGTSDFFYCIYTYDSAGTSTYNGKLTGSVPATFAKYAVCAHLENSGTGNSADAQGGQTGTKNFYCRLNQQ